MISRLTSSASVILVNFKPVLTGEPPTGKQMITGDRIMIGMLGPFRGS